jgi:hypothetical protein
MIDKNDFNQKNFFQNQKRVYKMEENITFTGEEREEREEHEEPIEEVS